MELYVAKCQDLRINASKQQMTRFFEIIVKNQQAQCGRKLNLSECGLGDSCLQVISKILKKKSTFAQVDLSKNDFSNDGLRILAETMRDHNSTVVHLDLGGNHIGPEGTMHLLQCLLNHPSLVSLNLANNDCYKNKIKIGQKGAEALKFLLQSP
jgi:Ran GTPase-activating protein (RanGAP) involved in mRNA processing and transport